MTREEAIELINQLYMRADFTDEYGDFDDTEPYQEAIDFITDLLKNVGEDCISRKAVLNAMYELCDTGESLKENKWRDNPHIDAIVDAIEELPTIPQTDSVPKGVFDQVKWERDIAIEQLKDLGYGLGEKPRKQTDSVLKNIKAELMAELTELDNYQSKDDNVYCRINSCKRHINIIDKYIPKEE